jgi:PAS domain-containing protein
MIRTRLEPVDAIDSSHDVSRQRTFVDHERPMNPAPADQAAALRRAIIRVWPDYYSWPEARQERHRLQRSREDDFRIRQAAVQSLFGLDVRSEEELEALLDSFDDARYLLLNSTLLPLQGIGADSFFLNESLPDDQSLLDFETLGDYARNDHQFQERARKQEDPGYVVRPYRGDLHHCWARLQVDGAFHYADLRTQAGYLVDALEELGSDRIQALIPHEYVDGSNHGKREGRGFLYDKRIDANGLEGHLDELQHRYYAYVNQRYEDLLGLFDQSARKCVYVRDRSRPDDPHMEFVFSDKTALDAVRFRHFVSDCRLLVGDNRELETRLDHERRAALDFLEESHRDIMNNFDPTVVKLRQKRKIILADGKLKHLL